MYFRHREDHYAVGNYRHEPIATPQSRLRRHRRRSDAVAHAVHARATSTSPSARRTRLCRRSRVACGRTIPRGRSTGCSRSRRTPARSSASPPNVRGFWVCEAVWVTHGGGMGRQVAEWMATGEPSVRPGRGRREPLLPVPDDAAVRARAREAAVPRGVRHPPSAPADGRAPRKLRLTPFYDAARGARRGVRHRRRMGTAAVVRGERARWCRRRAVGAARRLGRAALVADRGRRAPRDARARRAVRHHAVREVRRRPGRMRSRSSSGSARTGSTGRSARSSTRRCSRRGRDPLRPDGDAQGRRAVPRRDRRRLGPARPRVAARADPRRRARRRSPSAPARCSRSACGDRARATCCRRSPTTTCSNEAFPYLTARYLNVGEVGPVWAQRISYAGELGLGALRAVRDGRPRVGPAVGGRARARDRRGRARARSTRCAWRRATGSGARTSTPSTIRSRRGSGSRCAWTRTSSRAGPRSSDRWTAARRTSWLHDARRPGAVVMGKEPIRPATGSSSYVTSAAYGYSIGRGHRLRLPAGRPRRRGHAARDRVLRRTTRGDGGRRSAVGPQGRTPEGLREPE